MRTRVAISFSGPNARVGRPGTAFDQAPRAHSLFGPTARSDHEARTATLSPILANALNHLRHIDQCIADCDTGIDNHVRHSDVAQRIQAVAGVGPLTASALIATVANPRDFKNGRQMAAWSGLVPKQNSSGGKQRLGVITKRGDSYLRGLLTQGARSPLQLALKREALKRSRLEQWIFDLHARVGYHKTLVAIANKHVRIIWAILAKGESYDPNAWRRQAPTRSAVAA
jgi:transposase